MVTTKHITIIHGINIATDNHHTNNPSKQNKTNTPNTTKQISITHGRNKVTDSHKINKSVQRTTNIHTSNNKQRTNNRPHKTKDDTLTICFWNGQSIAEKTDIINDFSLEKDIDIYLIAETWLSDTNHSKAITNLKGNTRNFINYPRPYSDKGGGLGCIHKKQLSVVRTMLPFELTSMQVLELTLSIYSKKYTLVVIYRSEPASNHWYTMSTFFKELTELLSHYNTKRNEVIITGDFNIHVNDANNSNTKKLMAILDMFNLVQHIKEPTHRHGNTLDLLITREKTKVLDFYVGDQLSDHNNILFKLDLRKPDPVVKTVTNRQIKRINVESFSNDIRRQLAFTPSTNLSEKYLNNLVDVFNSSSIVLNKHAPLKTRQVIVRDPTPWTNEDIRPEKQKRRKLERVWKKSKSHVDFENFRTQKNKVNTILKTKREAHITKLINDHKGDSKTLFKVFHNTVYGQKTTPFPSGKSNITLASEFSKFFTEKIDKIRADLDACPNDMHQNEPDTFSGEMLRKFSPLSSDEVKKLIIESKTTTCELDPIPTELLKSSMNDVLHIITEIINTSLKIGIMPDILKHALIKPLLKKLDLELIHKNYRPVSNLSFLSKLIEGAVIKQYAAHLDRNGLHDPHQSAYKKHHSTETLLTKVKNDIHMKMDNGQVVMLVLLDLSAAFDTIDHNILLNRLEKRFGVTGDALKWFKSYLTGRTQSVIINGTESEKCPLKYGVPQGSKLGPILFNS